MIIPKHKHIHHYVDHNAHLNEKDPPLPPPPLKKRTGLSLQQLRENLPNIVLNKEQKFCKMGEMLCEPKPEGRDTGIVMCGEASTTFHIW